MESRLRMELMVFVVLVLGFSSRCYGAVSHSTMNKIYRINKEGPYLGIVVPNFFEMNPLLQSTSFVADQELPYLDFAGKHKIIHAHTYSLISLYKYMGVL